MPKNLLKIWKKHRNHKIMIQSSSSDQYIRHYNIQVLNPFDPDLQLINTKMVVKNKLKELLGESKNLKAQNILVLEYKKIYDHKSMCKIFNSSTKLLVNDSGVDKEFRSIHESAMSKIKRF